MNNKNRKMKNKTVIEFKEQTPDPKPGELWEDKQGCRFRITEGTPSKPGAFCAYSIEYLEWLDDWDQAILKKRIYPPTEPTESPKIDWDKVEFPVFVVDSDCLLYIAYSIDDQNLYNASGDLIGHSDNFTLFNGTITQEVGP